MTGRRLKKSTIYLIYSLGFVALVGVAYLIEGAFNKQSLDNTTYVNDTILTDEVEPVVAENKKIARPYKDSNVKILQSYYDYKADHETQKKSIIVYNNTYLQSSGVSYGGPENFDVTAVMDGKVISVENDEMLGSTVQIEHENNVISVYQSLKDVTVKVNDTVSTGDVIASAGTNNLNKDFNNHLYFELIIDGTIVNPEEYYDKTLNEL